MGENIILSFARISPLPALAADKGGVLDDKRLRAKPEMHGADVGVGKQFGRLERHRYSDGGHGTVL